MHGISRLPGELLPCQECLCCMEVAVKLFCAVFMEVNGLEDNKKRNMQFREVIVFFIPFSILCEK